MEGSCPKTPWPSFNQSPLHSTIPCQPSNSSLPRVDIRSSTPLAHKKHEGSKYIQQKSMERGHFIPKKSPSSYSFMPLPSIVASPICTPTSSLSSRHIQVCSNDEEQAPPDNEIDSNTSHLPVSLLISSPKRTSIHPTSPSRAVRRSATCFSHLSTTSQSTSATSPASLSPRVCRKVNCASLQRCMSEPAMSQLHEALLTPFPSRNDTREISYNTGHMSPSFQLTYSSDSDSENSANSDLRRSGNSTQSGQDALLCSTTDKDAIRQYYALKEILYTETGYLYDLKALVTIYLRNLPVIPLRTHTVNSTFSRAPTSLASNTWSNSYLQLQAAALASSTTLPDTPTSQYSTIHAGKESLKMVSRSVFTESEIEILNRNSEELLELHENFVHELQELLAPLGLFSEYGAFGKVGSEEKQECPENLDEAIRLVSEKFVNEGSRFRVYETFCAGHLEAVDAVRKAMQRYPLEWDLYEQRCSALVSKAALEPRVISRTESDDRSSGNSLTSGSEDRRRAMSLTSLDNVARCVRPQASLADIFSSSEQGKPTRRIAFTDYMIKPIQRICKYPLLLEQLKCSSSGSGSSHSSTRHEGNLVVENAAAAMKEVASSVDDARRRQDIATRSSLISSRFSIPNSTQHDTSYEALTFSFLDSLGTCIFAGCLDVIFYDSRESLSSSTSIKAKYLGAFLYPGGYLVLAKVSKGKKYEPRHWFSIATFTLFDEEDALLPSSFRLSSPEQQFELAASCQREKNVWVKAIHEALGLSPKWAKEPTPSFQINGKGGLILSKSNNTSPNGSPLPTIHSIPEVSCPSDTELSEPCLTAIPPESRQYERNRPAFRYDSANSSRRSSTASMKAIFSPTDSETILIQRSSTVVRHRVEQGLQDVTSQLCLNARSYASSHDEELFQAPKIGRQGFVRSNSAISVAGLAKNRLSRHESVRVPRRKSPIDEGNSLQNVADSISVMKGSLASRRNKHKLSITSITPRENIQSNQMGSSSPSSPSTSSLKTTPISASNESSSVSFVSGDHSVEVPLPKASRSLVRNVKGFFVTKSTPDPQPQPQPNQLHMSPSMLNIWKAPLRRRSKSISDRKMAPPSLFTSTTFVDCSTAGT